MRSPVAIAAALVTALLWAPARCAADVFDGLDVSYAVGAALGKITEEKADGSTQSFDIGGVPFAGMLNRDLAEHWSGRLEVEVLLDVINEQMIRQGFAGSLDYHLLGGARRIVHGQESVGTVSTSRYNLSLTGRAGLFNYAAASRKNPSQQVSGGTWEASAGLDYRLTVSEQNAIGATLTATVLTLPASVNRLTSSMAELLLYWRTYL